MLASMMRLAVLAGLVALFAACGPLRLGGARSTESAAAESAHTFVYVGTSGGILVYELDGPTGSLTRRGSSTTVNEVGALGSTTDGRLLVATSPSTGAVVSLSIDPRSGALEVSSRASSGGNRPTGLA